MAIRPRSTTFSTRHLSFWVGLSLWSGSLLADCEKWVARLVSAQGQVQVQPGNLEGWVPVRPAQQFCAGDKIRTLSKSRASLELPNQTYIALDQTTTVVFYEVEENEPSLIELLIGKLFARSRTPKSLNIRTPFINAAIRGTEFMIDVGSGKGEVTVFEGKVEASNAAGKVTVSDGQSASAGFGEAPKSRLALRPEDTVQWALYFPPLLDMASLERKAADPAVAEAAGTFAAGDVQGSLVALDRVPEARRDAEYVTVRVSILLSVGRVDEAEPLLGGHGKKQAPAAIDALRSVIALARNRKTEALEAADRALRADPRSAVAWVARSYALQGAFDLAGALEAADRAAELSPANALVEARRAELLASLERWTEARQAAEHAVQLDPKQARAHVIKGFAELRASEITAAETSFRTAAELANGDPLARVGLGLATIRRGDLVGGTADLETAASLDPGNSLIRSYLGKAYYEQKRNDVAEKQFQLAEQFDPKDPTPWFYDAIKKQTENRPVEALHDLQKAIQLNGNRAVYRSRLVLDEDLAARGAALGRIYNELGFQSRALVEGWKAVAEDPTDYTSHRLLADSYAALPRHEIARVSELLQSQLLQSININPVQPQLAESSLFLLGGLGPAALSLQEFNPLFDRNRFSLLASGLVGSNDTYSDEVVHSGLWNDFSYSLGQFHYQTRGYRRNNDIDTNIYNAFVQGRITPWLNLQAEYRHQDLDHGSLDSVFDPGLYEQLFFDHYRLQTTSDLYRFGVHVEPSEASDLLGSFIHLGRSVTAGLPSLSATTTTEERGDIGEVQYIQRYRNTKAILGGGFYELDSRTQVSQNRIQQGNGYVYGQIRFPETINWTLGLSIDIWDNSSQPTTRRQVNPKLGVLWNVTPDTLVRAAGFRILKRSLLANQTLEPTQVAGFNQFFDDFNGTDVTRWGVGLDHRFGPDLLGGAEWSRRALTVPRGEVHDDWHESQYRAYLLWTPHPRGTVGLEYYREHFTNSGSTATPPDTRNQILPLTLSYFDPSGIYAKFRASYFYQEVDLQTGPRSENVPFLDLGLGYRLPRRWGLAEIQFQNLLDRNYHYQGIQTRTPPQTGGVPAFLPFPPEFTVFARVTFAL